MLIQLSPIRTRAAKGTEKKHHAYLCASMPPHCSGGGNGASKEEGRGGGEVYEMTYDQMEKCFNCWMN